MADTSKPPISLTLPKSNTKYESDYLFPFFYNMLPEGTNKQVVCKHMRIDNNDYFSLLLITARYDTIGAVTIKKIN
jgi:serine/threonine-protein kinase HipA